MAEFNAADKKLINVLIVDDHQMIRDGLKLMLNSLNKTILFKVFEAESGEAAITKIERNNNIDLVIIDYQMPGLSAAESINRILRFKPEMKILALSNYDELPCIQSMMDAGAKGYVLKNIEPAEMLNAIKTILSNKIYYCNQVSIKLLEFKEEQKHIIDHANQILTKREIEVLKLIAMEMTNEEIARQLFVSKRTVDTHRQNLVNKLQVKNTVGLVKVAYRMNLVG